MTIDVDIDEMLHEASCLRGCVAALTLKGDLPTMDEGQYVRLRHDVGSEVGMGFPVPGRKADINEGVEMCRATPGAVLVDVRDSSEFAQGHIPGAINVPLEDVSLMEDVVPDLETPLFVYCLGGVRSEMAAKALKIYGFTNVRDIGAITDYRGDLER